MKRGLLLLMIFSACLSACTKSTGLTSPAAVEAQAVIDDNIITQYLKTNGLTAQTVDTTGVRYIIDVPGLATSLYNSSTAVTVADTGKLLTTGVVFSETNNFHPTYILGQVIRGWQLGIPKVGQGGTITLFVPSRYAYGPYAQPDIGLPANAVLIFNITVLNVTN
jgi:FKBP-type peptidyl-prolyl cis-trans isomerase FkpA